MAAQWPPRSPHEALLSTPGGRERMRRLAERQSPSPSLSKLRTSRSVPALNDLPDDMDIDQGDDDDDEDDEEMLQLKLQAIQARMKLKKLQAAKAQKKAGGSATATTDSSGATKGLPVQSKLAAARDRMERVPGQNPGFEVPASPVRKATGPSAAELQTSPQRILLGIDKGRKATEMSLKRAPSMRKLGDDVPPQQGGAGGYLRKSNTVSGQIGGQAGGASRPMSFNERLAAVRSEETSRQEKQKRIQQVRTKAFSIGRQEMEDYKTKAVDLPEIPYKAPEYTREDILAGKSHGNGLPRSSTTPALGGGSGSFSDDPFGSSTASGSEEASFESYSGLHLSKRILPHKVLTRAITGKKTYVLKDLLKHIKAPDWCLPEVESDIVVFAIVANKSDPKSHRPTPGKEQSDRGKYMVINLVDLTYEVDLFLFNTGFDRFWKLTPGTVLAILNPNIMPPPQGREDTGRFGLVINSDEDTILEIGSARDLGYCKSVKKDGTLCNSWVNARRSEYCEFHTNEAIRKAREGRFELNQMSFGGGGKKPNSRELWQRKQEEAKKSMGNYDRFTQSHYFVSNGRSTADLMDDEKVNGIVDRVEREEALKRRLAAKEKERDIAKKLGEMGAGAGREYMVSAASRAASRAASAASGGSSSANASSGSSLSSGGGGSSALTAAGTSISSLSLTAASQQLQHPSLPGQNGNKWDARALGLVRDKTQPNNFRKVELGPPLKRKRPESSASNSTSLSGGVDSSKNAGAAYGWGSDLRSKLSRMKEGERLDGRTITAGGGIQNKLSMGPSVSGGGSSPVRKKTRFVTERGIREAGRDSLGESLSAAAKLGRQVVLDDDDDDDLIVVK
ncbi:DNA replication licensing factor mcm10 [Naviculisporaceae sp. PSN 640]